MIGTSRAARAATAIVATHPLNLVLRFLLELAALGAFGLLGWKAAEGPVRFVAAIGLPIAAATLWGVFAVPDDPSRSGKAPIPVSGTLRLTLELAFFAAAAWVLYTTKPVSWSLIFAGLVVVHYALSLDRITWLLRTH